MLETKLNDMTRKSDQDASRMSLVGAVPLTLSPSHEHGIGDKSPSSSSATFNGGVAPLVSAGMPSEKAEQGSTTHSFAVQSFREPTQCMHCTSLMRGVLRQGMACALCGFHCHRECMSQVGRTPGTETCPVSPSVKKPIVDLTTVRRNPFG